MTTLNKEEMAQELALLTDATCKLCKLHGNLKLDYPRMDGFRARSADPAKQLSSAQPTPPDDNPKPDVTNGPRPVFSADDVATLQDTICHCERCLPEDKRPTPLFGKGKKNRPLLLIVGDAANSCEDVKQENFFPEPAAELLKKMLAAINLKEEDVFQTNIIRCALDKNKVPFGTQLKNCRPHLIELISLLQPAIICTMGQLASQTLLENKNQLIALRGRFHQFNNIPVMATYHPSQLLQIEDLKKAAWYDLQLIQHKLGKIHHR